MIVIAGLALLAGIIYILFFFDFNKPAAPAGGGNNAPAAGEPAAKTPAGANQAKKVIEVSKEEEPREFGEADLIRLGALFAERFGSYSNQSNYRNMRDLEIFMTKSFQDWVENFIKQAIERKLDNAIYYGISTKAVSQKAEYFDDEAGKAKVVVRTQRKEATGDTQNSASFQQDIEILFLKEGGVWKVDKAAWQNKQDMQKSELLFR